MVSQPLFTSCEANSPPCFMASLCPFFHLTFPSPQPNHTPVYLSPGGKLQASEPSFLFTSLGLFCSFLFPLWYSRVSAQSRPPPSSPVPGSSSPVVCQPSYLLRTAVWLSQCICSYVPTHVRFSSRGGPEHLQPARSADVYARSSNTDQQVGDTL